MRGESLREKINILFLPPFLQLQFNLQTIQEQQQKASSTWKTEKKGEKTGATKWRKNENELKF